MFFEGQHTETEGCLSLPGIGAEVGRAAKVRVRAQDVKGEWFGLEAEGFLSRALQHEIDHLDGILLFSRVNALKRGVILRRIDKLRDAGEWHNDFVRT
jgi:peptide deformylase